jgi:hypothetical protein
MANLCTLTFYPNTSLVISCYIDAGSFINIFTACVRIWIGNLTSTIFPDTWINLRNFNAAIYINIGIFTVFLTISLNTRLRWPFASPTSERDLYTHSLIGVKGTWRTFCGRVNWKIITFLYRAIYPLAFGRRSCHFNTCALINMICT